MNGKGSKRRPTDEAAYAAGFERIFGKRNGMQRVREAQADAEGAEGQEEAQGPAGTGSRDRRRPGGH